MKRIITVVQWIGFVLLCGLVVVMCGDGTYGCLVAQRLCGQDAHSIQYITKLQWKRTPQEVRVICEGADGGLWRATTEKQ